MKVSDTLEVRTSTIPGAGKGLFYVGATPIGPNRKITEYSAHQVDSQMNPKSFYVLQVGEGRFLDSENPSNAPGRYINSSKGSGRRANVRFTMGSRIYHSGGRYWVPIYTTKTINPGTELLINYGQKYRLPKQ